MENDTTYGLASAEATGTIAAPELDIVPRLPSSYRPRIGLIGAGGITEAHLKNYRTLGLDVAAICDVDEKRACARRDAFYPQASVHTDCAELLSIADIEVVDIATHPGVRAPLIDAALRAGKHVLSQKPFALDLDDAGRLADLADAQGLRLAVNQNGRWAPHFRYLSEAVRTGLIGEVGSIDFTVQWDHTWIAGTAFENIHQLVLYDFAVHWFDIATVLMGGRRARRVFASVAKLPGQHYRPPALAQVQIDYGDAQVRMGFNAHVLHGQEDRTVVCGSQGTLRSFGPGLNAQEVTLHTEAGMASAPLQGDWFSSGFQGTMCELLCAIEEGREPTHSARNNLATLELTFAAIASANGQRSQIPGDVRQITVT